MAARPERWPAFRVGEAGCRVVSRVPYDATSQLRVWPLNSMLQQLAESRVFESESVRSSIQTILLTYTHCQSGATAHIWEVTVRGAMTPENKRERYPHAIEQATHNTTMLSEHARKKH